MNIVFSSLKTRIPRAVAVYGTVAALVIGAILFPSVTNADTDEPACDVISIVSTLISIDEKIDNLEDMFDELTEDTEMSREPIYTLLADILSQLDIVESCVESL